MNNFEMRIKIENNRINTSTNQNSDILNSNQNNNNNVNNIGNVNNIYNNYDNSNLNNSIKKIRPQSVNNVSSNNHNNSIKRPEFSVLGKYKPSNLPSIHNQYPISQINTNNNPNINTPSIYNQNSNLNNNPNSPRRNIPNSNKPKFNSSVKPININSLNNNTTTPHHNTASYSPYIPSNPILSKKDYSNINEEYINLKENNKKLSYEKIHYKSELQKLEKDLLTKEKLINELITETQVQVINNNPEATKNLNKNKESYLVGNLKRQLKEIQREYKNKEEENDKLKKNTRVTRYYELSEENSIYYEEIKRLKIVNSELIKKTYNCNSVLNDNYEIMKSLKIKSKADDIEIYRVKEEINKINGKYKEMSELLVLEKGGSGGFNNIISSSLSNSMSNNVNKKVEELIYENKTKQENINRLEEDYKRLLGIVEEIGINQGNNNKNNTDNNTDNNNDKETQKNDIISRINSIKKDKNKEINPTNANTNNTHTDTNTTNTNNQNPINNTKNLDYTPFTLNNPINTNNSIFTPSSTEHNFDKIDEIYYLLQKLFESLNLNDKILEELLFSSTTEDLFTNNTGNTDSFLVHFTINLMKILNIYNQKDYTLIYSFVLYCIQNYSKNYEYFKLKFLLMFDCTNYNSISNIENNVLLEKELYKKYNSMVKEFQNKCNTNASCFPTIISIIDFRKIITEEIKNLEEFSDAEIEYIVYYMKKNIPFISSNKNAGNANITFKTNKNSKIRYNTVYGLNYKNFIRIISGESTESIRNHDNTTTNNNNVDIGNKNNNSTNNNVDKVNKSNPNNINNTENTQHNTTNPNTSKSSFFCNTLSPKNKSTKCNLCEDNSNLILNIIENYLISNSICFYSLFYERFIIKSNIEDSNNTANTNTNTNNTIYEYTNCYSIKSLIEILEITNTNNLTKIKCFNSKFTNKILQKINSIDLDLVLNSLSNNFHSKNLIYENKDIKLLQKSR